MAVPRTALAVALALALAVAALAQARSSQPRTQPRVLLFTKTTGFRHASIPHAVRAIRELAGPSGFAVDATEDGRTFTDANLRRYGAVVFLLTTGDVLDPAQQAAFQRFVRRGGGYAGVHSATDTEYGWPWYGRLVGAYFRNHPAVQTAAVRVESRSHPSTVALPRTWARTDEWYGFARNPRGSVRVLATLDESTYAPGPGAMGADHPIAWAHAFEGGRAWYTGGGHTDEAYDEPLFRSHLLHGIRWAAGLTPPRIRSVSVGVRAQRAVVTVRYATCVPCRGRLGVAGGTKALRPAGGVGQARSRPLRPGRHALTVTVEDPLTRLGATVRRTVVVR
jgi:type 1 glutamine amidotransferase